MQSLHGFERPVHRLNAACFFAPSPGSIGLESGINFLYGPSVVNFDMSIQKQFVVKEKFALPVPRRCFQRLQPHGVLGL